ncbi:MAG TPA: hypothetical protein VEY93_02665 [Longimicrobium sp.]|nr:hypothetical protein [Longimicrobium sp.]
MTMLHLGRRVAVCVLALSTTACAAGGGLGTLGEILAGAAGAGGQQQGQQGQGGVVTVEVQGVDQQRQVINVATQQGQRGAIRYDQRTQVVYQQQQYPVTALERGDVVDMEIQQISQSEYYVGRIQVRQSVQERNGQPAPGTTSGQGGMGGTTTGQAQVFSGQVAQIDHQRNSLVIQIRQGVNATAYVPSNSPRATMDEFHRLRVGDFVRFEGRAVNNQQIEVIRFY